MRAKIQRIIQWFRSLNELVRMYEKGENWHVALFIHKDGRQTIMEMAGRPAVRVQLPDVRFGLVENPDEPSSYEGPKMKVFFKTKDFWRDTVAVCVYEEAED